MRFTVPLLHLTIFTTFKRLQLQNMLPVFVLEGASPKNLFSQTTCLDNMQCAPLLCLTIERFGSFGQLCVVINGLQWWVLVKIHDGFINVIIIINTTTRSKNNDNDNDRSSKTNAVSLRRYHHANLDFYYDENNTNDDNAKLTITQMMIMRGQAKRMQSPLPKSHTAIGLPTGTARPHCTIGVVMMI